MSSISPISALTGSSNAKDPTSAAAIQENFMTLLLTQLRHQNPLEPMKNEELSMQLATMSQLQEVENLNSKFDAMLLAQQVAEANSMLGKHVEYFPEGDDRRIGGTVNGVEIKGDQVMVKIDSNEIPLSEVVSVSNNM